MFDSLPYRNDAALVLRRLVRSLPKRRGVIGVGTCDKGLPAMMMAVASFGELAGGGRSRAASRCRRAEARTPARCRRSAPGSRTGSSRSRRRRSSAARVREPRRRLPVPRHRRDLAGRRGGDRADRAARGARTVGAADLAGRRPAHGAGGARAVARRTHARRRAHGRGARERDARARRVRRLDEPPDPRPRGRARGRARAADRRRLAAGQPKPCRASSTRCRTGRRTIRRSASSWPAAFPR